MVCKYYLVLCHAMLCYVPFCYLMLWYLKLKSWHWMVHPRHPKTGAMGHRKFQSFGCKSWYIWYEKTSFFFVFCFLGCSSCSPNISSKFYSLLVKSCNSGLPRKLPKGTHKEVRVDIAGCVICGESWSWAGWGCKVVPRSSESCLWPNVTNISGVEIIATVRGGCKWQQSSLIISFISGWAQRIDLLSNIFILRLITFIYIHIYRMPILNGKGEERIYE